MSLRFLALHHIYSEMTKLKKFLGTDAQTPLHTVNMTAQRSHLYVNSWKNISKPCNLEVPYVFSVISSSE